jgi:hypothetical protein
LEYKLGLLSELIDEQVDELLKLVLLFSEELDEEDKLDAIRV